MLRAHNIPPQANIQASSDLSCNGSNQYLLNVCAFELGVHAVL